MAKRLIIDRLDGASSTPAADDGRFDPPTLSAIRLVFGVGRRPGQAPSAADFSPVYTVEIPVFSLTGLDSDGIYEFDAARTLEDLQGRAQRRSWALRLELTFVQEASSVHRGDLYIETPYAEAGPSCEVAGVDKRGTTTLGGARELVLASSLAHDADQVAALGGKFVACIAAADPRETPDDPSASLPREVELNLTRYEFQG